MMLSLRRDQPISFETIMGLAYVRMSLTGLNRAVASDSLLIYDGYYRPAVM